MQKITAIRFLWHHIKPYKWLYFIMLLAPILNSFYPFLFNHAIKLFLDILSQNDQVTFQQLSVPIALFMGGQIFIDIIWRISNIAEWRSEPYVRRSIILDTTRRVFQHPYIFFQNNFTGSVTTKIRGLLKGYDAFWSQMHHGIMAKFCRLITSLTILLVTYPKIGASLLLPFIGYGILMWVFSKKLRDLASLESESSHRLLGLIGDNLTNIATLFAFGARPRELKRLDQQIQSDFIPSQINEYKYEFKRQVIGGLVHMVIFSMVLWLLIRAFQLHTISIGDFAFILGITVFLLEDIWYTGEAMQDFARSMGDFKSALSILNYKAPFILPSATKPLSVAEPTIAFEDILFYHEPEIPLFKHFNFHIAAGEKVGIVGKSGAGKSTLVQLLLRYFLPGAGKILIDGQDIQGVSERSLRQQIALIPQDTLLFHRTLLENIRYGNPRASDQEVVEACKKAYIHEHIMQTPQGYQTLVGERGVKLSGGQRQRVAIARAMLKNAPILVLDEATSALDGPTERLIQQSLEVLIQEQQRTVIAIAHRLSTLKHMDRIVVLDQGKIIEEGSHETLLATPNSKYKQLWEEQLI